MLNFGNLAAEGNRPEFEHDVFHHPDPFIALSRDLAELILDLFSGRTDLFDFLSELLAARECGLELLIQLSLPLVELGDFFQIGFGIAFLLDRVIVFVPGFFQFAFDVLNFLIDLLKFNRRLLFLAFQGLEFPA